MSTRVEGRWSSSAVAPAVLWGALSDPERLAETLPDVGLVEVADPDRFTASVRPATGLGFLPMQLDVRIRDRVEPSSVRLVGDGAAGEHRVSFDVALAFAAGPDGGGTEVTWSASVQAYGVLGSLTQRVLPMLLRDQITLVLAAAESQSAPA